MALTYADYLKLDELLSLQQPRSQPPEHDEMLFIIIHQTYELWFKLLLHEFDSVKTDFSSNRLYDAVHTLKRVRMVLKTLVAQIDILETMTPMSFTSFRDRLETASGFQSTQFRELEYVLGYKRGDMDMAALYAGRNPAGFARLQRRVGERSVVDHFYDLLEHRGVRIPPELKHRDLTKSNEPNDQIQAGLIELYQTQPDVAILLEEMTDIDEGLQEWRYRHVKLVERTIGSKHGTGGSPGVAFLKESLFKPIFPDLWAIRHKL